MSKEKKQSKEKLVVREITEGYQPTKGDLDSSNPPQGGSGLPSKAKNENGKKDKKD
ncbi:MAG: hypothetical protein ACE5G1_06030 [bacterium]